MIPHHFSFIHIDSVNLNYVHLKCKYLTYFAFWYSVIFLERYVRIIRISKDEAREFTDGHRDQLRQRACERTRQSAVRETLSAETASALLLLALFGRFPQ